MSHYEHEPSAAEFVAAPGERRDADLERWRADEHALGAAYLRLRALIPGAFATPFAPSAEQVWAHTESCLKALKERAEAAGARAATPPKADPALQQALLEAIDRAMPVGVYGRERGAVELVAVAIMDKLADRGLIAREGRE